LGDKVKHPYLATHPSIYHDKFFASNNGAQYDPIFHNGQQSVFQLSITISPQLRIMPSQGGQLKQWTFGNGIFTSRWVPDGQFLVYAANNDKNVQGTYFRTTADGGKETLLIAAKARLFVRFGDCTNNDNIVCKSTKKQV
jgi:Tol biopolymer transport system component